MSQEPPPKDLTPSEPAPEPLPPPESKPEPKPEAPPAADKPAAEKAPAEKAPAEKVQGRSWFGLALGVLLVLAVAGAAVTFPRWRDRIGLPMAPGAVERGKPADEVEALRADLAATTERLRQLEVKLAERPAAPGESAAATDALAQRLAAVEQSVRALEAKPQLPARLAEEVDTLGRQVAEMRKTAADAATVLRLSDRVEQAEAAMRELQARRSSATALLLAVGQLREAVNLGFPFDAELRALRVLAPQDEAVVQAEETMKERAPGGIPTRIVLADRFHTLAPEIVRAEALPAGDGWWRQTLNRVMALVTIRREDGAAAGDGAAAVVARAEARLGQGDLAGAARELGRLSGPAAEVAAPWMTDARARVAADRTLSELTAHSVALAGARQ